MRYTEYGARQMKKTFKYRLAHFVFGDNIVDRKEWRESIKGSGNPFYGKSHSPEAREKMSKAHTGIKRSPMSHQTRENISKASKGKPKYFTPEHKQHLSEASCGQRNHRFGKHWDIEHREKQSQKLRGANAPNWKGGVTAKNLLVRQTLSYKLWREQVFRRDNYTCQKCGQVGGRLHPHHIKSFALYPELRFEVNNGITLCESCHRHTDNYANQSSHARVVPARDTSQLCSRCGARVSKDLSVRIRSCPHCGLTIDRDFNAALNILRLGQRAFRCLAPYPENPRTLVLGSVNVLSVSH